MRPTTTGPVLRPIRMRIAGPWRASISRLRSRMRALDPERGVDGAPRAVLVRDGRAEEGHHAVARVLVDRALEAVDLGGDGLEAPVHDLVNILGVKPLGQAREPGDVREQHGDLAALALDRRPRLEYLVGKVLWRVGSGRPGSRCNAQRCRRVRRSGRPGQPQGRHQPVAAPAAEPRTCAQHGGALRAAGFEGFPALVAEPVSGRGCRYGRRGTASPAPPWAGFYTRSALLTSSPLGLFGSRWEQLPG